VPVEFLTNEQAAAFGRFTGPPSRMKADQSRIQSVLIRRETHRTYVSLCSAAAGRFVGGAWPPSGAGHRHEYQTMAASPMIFMAVKK
jgi:hypothetical protein